MSTLHGEWALYRRAQLQYCDNQALASTVLHHAVLKMIDDLKYVCVPLFEIAHYVLQPRCELREEFRSARRFSGKSY